MGANDLFDRLLAGTDAARPFLETPEGRIYSYGDLIPATGRIANALAGLGVRPGDRVAAQVKTAPWRSASACAWAGYT